MRTAPAPPPRADSAPSPAERSLRAPLIVALAAIGCTILLLHPLGGAGLFPTAAKSGSNIVAPSVTWGVSARAAVSEGPMSAPTVPVVEPRVETATVSPPAMAEVATSPAAASQEPVMQLATGLRSKRQLAAMAVPSPPIQQEPQQAAPARTGADPAPASATAEAAPIIPSAAQNDMPSTREPLPLETSVVPLNAATMRVVRQPPSPGEAVSNSGARSGSSSPNG